MPASSCGRATAPDAVSASVAKRRMRASLSASWARPSSALATCSPHRRALQLGDLAALPRERLETFGRAEQRVDLNGRGRAGRQDARKHASTWSTSAAVVYAQTPERCRDGAPHARLRSTGARAISRPWRRRRPLAPRELADGIGRFDAHVGVGVGERTRERSGISSARSRRPMRAHRLPPQLRDRGW